MSSNGAEGCEVSILMPCLNEEKTVGLCVAKAVQALRDQNISGEVVVADNGSTDKSVEIAEAEGARVVHVGEKGLGHALVGGTASCQGRYVLTADSDCSYDVSIIQPFLEELRSGKDLIIGNRFQGGIAEGAMPFLHYWVGNPALSWTGRTLFQSKIGDFHSGQRGYDREKLLGLGLRCGGMEYCSEMIAKAEINRWNIGEVPVTLSPDKRGRKSHLRTWRDGWRHLTFMLMMCPRWMFRNPGWSFFSVGLLLLVLAGAQPSTQSITGLVLVGTGLPLIFFYYSFEQTGEFFSVLPQHKNRTFFETIFRRGTGYFFGVAALVMATVALVSSGSPNLYWLTLLAVGLETIGFNHFFYVMRFMQHSGCVDGVPVSDFSDADSENPSPFRKAG